MSPAAGAGSPQTEEGPIGKVSARLEHLYAGIRSSARRSRRISWFAWGFLFALSGIQIVPLLFVLALVPSISPPFGGFLFWTAIGATPSAVLFALVVRELWVGSGEAVRFREGGPFPASVPTGEPGPIGLSLQTVQESQKRISQVRSELEISMVPLVLGGSGILFFGGFLLLAFALGANFANLTIWSFALAFAVPLAILVAVIWVLWSLAKLWVAQYQEGLDEQVLQMISLEGEFFGRFASGPTGS